MRTKAKMILWIMGVLWLAAACTKDTPDDRGKIDVIQTIAFKMDFSEFGSDKEVAGTRSGNNPDHILLQTVDMGDGLLAQVSLQKEPGGKENDPKKETRALNNGTYTMLAYSGGTLVGEMAGTVSDGIWTPTDGKPLLHLTPGVYDFVCYNGDVGRSENNLTLNRSEAETALIGRASDVSVNGDKQLVVFQMKHAGARMKVKLTGYMALSGNVTARLESTENNIPASAVYNVPEDTWRVKNKTVMNEFCSFPAGAPTSICNEYRYFVPTTNGAHLKLTFTGGRIYDKEMNGKGLTFNPKPALEMTANGSYIINVRLIYDKFIYLMSDGTTGRFSATTYGGGEKTPVGVVVDTNTHLAIALHDAGNAQWVGINSEVQKQSNTTIYPGATVYNDIEGYKWTWEPGGTVGNYVKVGKKLNNQILYPAFTLAGNYNPDVPASGTLAGKKWHLPSAGEWKSFFANLGGGNAGSLNYFEANVPWNSNLMKIAFTQVEGTAPVLRYWLSTECDNTGAVFVTTQQQDMSQWGRANKDNTNTVRPFIKF